MRFFNQSNKSNQSNQFNSLLILSILLILQLSTNQSTLLALTNSQIFFSIPLAILGLSLKNCLEASLP